MSSHDRMDGNEDDNTASYCPYCPMGLGGDGSLDGDISARPCYTTSLLLCMEKNFMHVMASVGLQPLAAGEGVCKEVNAGMYTGDDRLVVCGRLARPLAQSLRKDGIG